MSEQITINVKEELALLGQPACNQQLQKVQQSKTRGDVPTFSGTFQCWRYWSKSMHKFVTTHTLPEPDGKKPFTFLITVKDSNKIPNRVEVIRDPETNEVKFRILSEVDYVGEHIDKKLGTTVETDMPNGGPTTKEVLQYHFDRIKEGKDTHPVVRHAVETLMTPEGEFRTSVWHTFRENDTLVFSVFAFGPEQLAQLKRTRENGSPELQDQTPVKLENVSCSVRVQPYVPKVPIEETVDDAENECAHYLVSCGRDKFSYMVNGAIKAETTDEQGRELTMCDAMHRNYAKNQRPLVPYEDVASGKSRIPYTTYWWVDSPNYVSEDGSLLRVPLPNNVSEHDFLYTARNSDKPPSCCYVWSLWDVYGPEERYSVRIRAADSSFKSGNPAHAFGILDTQVYPRICLATVGFPCHILANYNSKTTISMDHNALKSPEERRNGVVPFHLGDYHFYCEKAVFDFERGLPKFGIPLSQERMQRAFADAAKQVKNKTDRMYSVFKDDDEDVVVFKNAFAKQHNPLHSDGELSQVINFGCGERPAFDCTNATDLLTQLDFYALTTHIFDENESRPDNTEAGDALFDQLQQNDPAFGYQIFGLRRRRRGDIKAEPETPAKKATPAAKKTATKKKR